MDKILEIDRENLVAVVQPGVINAHLKAAVAAEGLFYPPDPASFEMCSIGGNLGTHAGGLCCVRDGQTRAAVPALYYLLKRSEERKASAEIRPTLSPKPERSFA